MSLKEDRLRKHPREKAKRKGVPAEPHPLDRISGTGLSNEIRKNGGGRRNWGTYKDDLKEPYDFQRCEYESNELNENSGKTFDQVYKEKPIGRKISANFELNLNDDRIFPIL